MAGPLGYQDLREHIAALDAAGLLRRVSIPINKDTELHPLVRLQFRGLPESERRAFLFDNLVDSNGKKYDMPVLVCAMAGSSQIYAVGMRCAVEQIHERWEHAMKNPIKPVIVDKAPVQEVVIEGKELLKNGLGRLPVPISTPGFDNGAYTSASHWVGMDPDTGHFNVGNYRGMIKAENRMGILPGSATHGLRRQLELWRKKGADRAPVACVIGTPPHICYPAVTRLPVNLCEYDVSGGLVGEPVKLVKCLTHDIMVPANAEIVIEGWVPVNVMEMEGPFGEFPGYMAKRDYNAFFEVERITMRKKPIYLAFLSQLPPSESSKIRGIGFAAAAKKHLHDNGFDNVLDVHLFEQTGSMGLSVVRMKKRKPDDGIQALRSLSTKFGGKFCVAVDEDIDNQDLDSVVWAIAFRVQPHRNTEIVDVPFMGLDPSLAPPEAERGFSDAANRPKGSGLLMDATRDWAYPPISLPRKEFMDHAIQLWEQLQLPKLALKSPWFGYELGHWTDEERAEADLAVKGRAFETGEKMKADRIPVTDRGWS